MLWVHWSADYCQSLYTVLELLTWHKTKAIHPSNTALLNGVQVASVAGRRVRLPLYDETRDHRHWLRGQLVKHGEVGRAVAAAFREAAGVDVRDADAVRAAFRALDAIYATAEEGEHPDSFYDPRHHWRADVRRASDHDYGWIDEPRGKRPPSFAGLAPGVPWPPASRDHPPPEVHRVLTREGPRSYNHREHNQWAQPGLAVGLRAAGDRGAAGERGD